MAIYYVDTATGSNSNTGTAVSAPFLTISYGLAQCVAGDILEIIAGTYTSAADRIDSQVNTVPSGASWNNPITVRAYQRGTVTLQTDAVVVRLTTNSPHYLIFQDLIFDGNTVSTEPVFLDGGHHIRFQRCTVTNGATFGVHSGPTSIYCEYLQCVVTASGLGGTPGTVGHAMYITSDNTLIDGCELYGNGAYGVHAFNNLSGTAPSNCVIRNNRIHGNGLNGGTTYGILVNHGDSNTIYNNIIYGQTILGAGGISIYAGATNTTVYRNTVTGCNGGGIDLQYYGLGSIVRGNIVYDNLTWITDNGGGSGTPTIDHNTANATDPSFVNAGAHNYALQSGSAARGANIAIGAVTTDYMGTTIASPYDCGAYQYQSGTLIAAGMNLQTALNAAVAGDTLILQAGRQFVGNYTLPVHSGSTAITVRSACDLPAAGVRVTPVSGASYAVLVPAAGGGAALATVAAAHDWTLLGITLINTPSGDNDILQLGDGSSAQNTLALVPYNLTVDRCLITGDPTYGQKRGISLQSGNTAITNCYIADCKRRGQDSQAIGGWNGPGPYLIDNGYLEGAGNNILFGGATTYIPLNIPADFTITNNIITKPIAWRAQGWQVKNAIEFKSGQRAVIDSNTISYCWSNAQNGIPIVMTVRNQDYDPNNAGAATNNYWNTIADVLISRNTITQAGGCFQVLGHDEGSRYTPPVPVPSGTLTNLTIRDNVFYDISQSYGPRAGWFELDYGNQITAVHNTVITSQPGQYSVLVYLINQPISNFVHTDNILVSPPFDGAVILTADDNPSLNGLRGTAALDAYAFPWTYTHNVVIGGSSTGYPAGNFYPATIAAVQFTNASVNDYRLLSSSPYHNAGTDGMDIGARFANAPAPGGGPPPPPPPPPPSCSYAVSPTTIAVASAGASGTVALTTTGGCTWTATSNVSWTTITSGASGTGSGTIAYTVAANASTSTRSGTITAGTQSIPVTQAAAVVPPPSPPGTPSNPTPADTATNVGTSQHLSWNLAANASTYNVAFGTVNPPPTVSVGQVATTYTPTLTTSTTYYWKVTAVGAGGSTAGPVWSFTTVAPPTPPGTPLTPNPATSATNIATSQVLSWNPTSNTLTYAVKFGTANPPPTVVSSQVGTSYTPTLAHSTTYYWQVTATGTGGSATGAVWTFTTVAPPPPPPPPPILPGTPGNPTPTDTAVNVPIHLSLGWSSTNATSYDVAFGSSNPPSLVTTGQVAASYTPSTLAYSTTYFWQIVAHTAGGNAMGPVWSFTTVAAPSPPPSPAPGIPANPTPTNAATGVAPHVTISWSADNATSYAVAFGTVSPPPIVSTSQVSPHYVVDALAFSTLYYWQITAINDNGRTDGPVWTFTTAPASPGIIIGGTVGTLMPWVKPTFFDPRSNRVSYANAGRLYFYVTRTTTLLATFSDVNLTIPNTNPVILNSAGQSPTSIFLQATGYTVVLKDHNGVQLWSIDDVEAINAEP